MNTHMYQHPLTSEHLKIVQEKLGYMVSGPQGAGRLACGDEGELSPCISHHQADVEVSRPGKDDRSEGYRINHTRFRSDVSPETEHAP